jgi:hypothetical protein
MGRESENLPLARASRLSVAVALQGGGRHAWRITRAVDCRSGTKGQPPLVFPALAGLRGRAAAPTGSRRAVGASVGVPRGTPCPEEAGDYFGNKCYSVHMCTQEVENGCQHDDDDQGHSGFEG